MVQIKKEILSEMIDHARDEQPDECCGILAGDGRLISAIYRVESEEKGPRTFFMIPERQHEAMIDIEKRGLEMMGIYHSHPLARPYPSRRDMEMAFYPECLYFIVSVREGREPEVGVFAMQDGVVREESCPVV